MIDTIASIANLLRDLGFLMYGGPMIAFTILVVLAPRIPHVQTWDVVRVYRSWGPGFGLSLGAPVLGALSLHWIQAGSFTWADSTTLESVGWVLFLVMWTSNFILEIWTLEPLRKLDQEGNVSDPSRYNAQTQRLGRHMVFQSLFIVGIMYCVTMTSQVV